MFDTNPPNWLMPSFMQRVDLDMINRNKREIIQTLRAFRNIMNEDKEIKEVGIELNRRGIERG